jgi:hypothetical protein
MNIGYKIKNDTITHDVVGRLCITRFFLAVNSIYGQDIFKKYGLKKPLTLSKGRYVETFPNKEIVQIGTIMLNTKTNKVVEFLEEDTTAYAYKAEFSSRWLSPDPLAEKYLELSPYVYCMNNPIVYIDSDGKQASFAVKFLSNPIKLIRAIKIVLVGAGVGVTYNQSVETVRQRYPKIFEMVEDCKKWYQQIDALGYKEIPEEVYKEWLQSLNREKKRREEHEQKYKQVIQLLN